MVHFLEEWTPPSWSTPLGDPVGWGVISPVRVPYGHGNPAQIVSPFAYKISVNIKSPPALFFTNKSVPVVSGNLTSPLFCNFHLYYCIPHHYQKVLIENTSFSNIVRRTKSSCEETMLINFEKWNVKTYRYSHGLIIMESRNTEFFYFFIFLIT